MTFTFCDFSRICEVASIPFKTGMEISINTISGTSFRQSSTASLPSLASATISKFACRSIRLLSPDRRISWSSANRILIGLPFKSGISAS
ncbi:MAG: hypothetical protein P8Z37_10130 [Acidobacteriota bacterium]